MVAKQKKDESEADAKSALEQKVDAELELKHALPQFSAEAEEQKLPNAEPVKSGAPLLSMRVRGFFGRRAPA